MTLFGMLSFRRMPESSEFYGKDELVPEQVNATGCQNKSGTIYELRQSVTLARVNHN